jgi:hypothetical protein
VTQRRAVGRPPRAGAPTKMISVRLTELEREAWERAAAGKSLAIWIRELCNQRAGVAEPA